MEYILKVSCLLSTRRMSIIMIGCTSRVCAFAKYTLVLSCGAMLVSVSRASGFCVGVGVAE